MLIGDRGEVKKFWRMNGDRLCQLSLRGFLKTLTEKIGINPPGTLKVVFAGSVATTFAPTCTICSHIRIWIYEVVIRDTTVMSCCRLTASRNQFWGLFSRVLWGLERFKWITGKVRVEEQKRKYRANKGLYEGNMIFNCRNKKRVLSDIQGETKKAAITVNDGC